jgi:hypothetical protein
MMAGFFVVNHVFSFGFSSINESSLPSLFTHSTVRSPAFLLQGRGREARLRVNLEPFGDTQGLELVERQAPVFRPGSREVHSAT